MAFCIHAIWARSLCISLFIRTEPRSVFRERWRHLRRIFRDKFNPTAVASYFPIQRRQRRDLLRRLHHSPHHFAQHFQHYVGATIMEVGNWDRFNTRVVDVSPPGRVWH
jgi:hypothetical protein